MGKGPDHSEKKVFLKLVKNLRKIPPKNVGSKAFVAGPLKNTFLRLPLVVENKNCVLCHEAIRGDCQNLNMNNFFVLQIKFLRIKSRYFKL